MVTSYHQGAVSSLDTVIANILKAPEEAFLAALEPNIFPIRDAALANGLMGYEQGQKSIIWTEGANLPARLVLDTAIASNATTEFDVTPISAVVPNMLIRFKDEIILVVSVDTTGGTCEVLRAQKSTTAETAIAVTDPGYILSVTPTEAADAGTASTAYGAAITNFVHYMEGVIHSTDLNKAMATHTPEGSIAYQVQQKFRELGYQLANALWFSIGDAATATRITMNGLRAQVDSTMVSAAVAALLFEDIDAGVTACMNNGVIPDTIFVPGNVKKGMASWGRVRQTYSGDPQRAGGSLQYFDSAAGPALEIVVDTSLPNVLVAGAEVLVCNKSNLRAGFVPLLPNDVDAYPGVPAQGGLRLERMARTGPVDKLQILGYASCQLLRPAGAWLLTGITSVDTDGV